MTTPTCCTGDCNQGRECPLRQRRRGWWPLLIVAAFCALLAVSVAHAEFFTGNTLLAKCQSADLGDRYDCLGYISGAADAAQHRSYCPPATATRGQIRDIVVAVMLRAPDIRHETADVIVAAALGQVWPCAPRQTPQRRDDGI
jgi:hypothetical protein